MLTVGTLQIVLAGLVFVTTLCLGGAGILLYRNSREPLRKRLHGSDGVGGVLLDPGEEKGGVLVGMFATLGGATGGKAPSSKLRTKMIQAGLTSPGAVQVFLGVKIMLLCFALIGVGALIVPMKTALIYKACMIFLVPGLLFFIPNFFLEIRKRKRTAEIQRNLPNMIDLLEICVSGGMGLDMAWNAVGEQTRNVSRTLADEMALTNLEMHLGEDRGVAIRHMAERTGSDDLFSLVAVLVQSERFGTSISDALVTFAASLREIRSQRAEEAAEKMAVTMLFPMILFIFPVEIIVAVGPAALEIVRLLGTG